MQAEETENLVSDVARIVGGEKSLIEDCGDSLSKIYRSQVCLIFFSILFNFHWILWNKKKKKKRFRVRKKKVIIDRQE